MGFGREAQAVIEAPAMTTKARRAAHRMEGFIGDS
jgi:hypothetical protein